ncbi:hypothetical protein ACFCYX_19380 [Streptomyces populi]|uniref:hypothetical protein n=1 Tax=Streptomyces populi TaxID=2058924 RepID=UPI0035E0A795
MATQIVPAPERADHPASAMSDADRRAHELASYVRPQAAEHEKVKDPLPIRPRGPHPQRATAAV